MVFLGEADRLARCSSSGTISANGAVLGTGGGRATSTWRDGIGAAALAVARGAGDRPEMAGAAGDGGISALPRTGAGSKLLCGEWAWLGSQKTLVLLACTMRKKKPPNETLIPMATSPTTAKCRSVRAAPLKPVDRVPPDTAVAGSLIGSGSLSAKAGALASFVTGRSGAS